MVDFFELEQLVAFSEAGTLSQAAARLHLSQPSLTRTIQRLESEFHVPLVDRERNRVALNSNGEIAVRYARRMLESRDEMLTQVREYDRANHTIVIESCAPAPLWLLLPELASAYPDMTVSSALVEHIDAPARLKNGEIQLAIDSHAADAGNGLLSIPFMREQLYLVVPRKHMLAQRGNIRFADFNGLDLLLRPDIGFWADVCRTMLPASRLLFQAGADEFDALAKSTDLPYFCTNISVTSVTAIPENRVAIPVTDPEATAIFHCICRDADKDRYAVFLSRVAKLGRDAGLLPQI